MAWRIHEYVLRGEIDNRVRGRVTGKVWLAGVTEPLELDLRGNCHPDLAGCRLVFENPAPIPFETAPPARLQKGEAGDITAARKVRVYDIPFEEAYAMIKAGGTPPEHMANSLYLEWYSKFNGRVVVESSDYRLQISEPEWRFSAEELAERAKRMEQGGEFVTRVELEQEEEPWDEFRAEQFLRESDATADRYRRLLEKYMDHPDSERLIAREMGWTWIEDALDAEEAAEAGRSEPAGEAFAFDEDDYEEPEPDPALEGISWMRDERGEIVHPIQFRANKILYCVLDEIRDRGYDLNTDDVKLENFIGGCMKLSAKLAGALNGRTREEDWSDPAMTIASLKRILAILNETLTAAGELEEKPYLEPESLTTRRTELFSLREEILALITELRKET